MIPRETHARKGSGGSRRRRSGPGTVRTTVTLLAALAAACTQLPPDRKPGGSFGPSDRRLEQEIALQGEREIRKELRDYPDREVRAYVERVGRRVVAVSDRRDIPYTFRVVDDDTMNAFTIGDGKVYVYKGLLRKLENEAQLASVLGHEVAHVTHFHTVVTARKAMETELFVGLAGAVIGEGEIVEIGQSVAASIIQNGFSRDQEDQADRVGLRYTFKAGYDVHQFPEVFEIFRREGGDAPKVFNDLFGSHSTPSERIAATRRLVREKYGPRQRGGRVGREDYLRLRARIR